MKCPSCGADAAGKFCGTCGAALAGASCDVCGAPLTAGGRFCHVCGTPLGAPRRAAGKRQMLPWIVAAVAVALLVVVFVARSGGPSSSMAGGGGPGGASPSGPGATTTDLSSMTPREQADRLFDRVMRASEGGNAGEVTFFGPMALQAYAMIGKLDADARFHVGLIEAALANDTGAIAQADTLAQEAPRHLFVPLIRWEVANRRGDTAALRRLYRQFLDNYDAEMASGKSEYDMHRTRLQAFRDEARGALGASSR
ncbi:MAG: zinc ribbon domain-containing protein [Gemmatimonadetes bacterium]|nr:zinc ribbon domain-containing protein [Gemmatimonadota bacterium]MBI2537505.1 zinc ribbon domain-containing protein [Gemmatimonadota bacterium]